MSSTQVLPRQFGKYVLVRKIAMGGMAEIFKAKTAGAEGFEKDVVIKRILPHFTEDGDFVKMFIDEASITSKLQHANIVQIFDFDVCEGSYYIAMELIEGVDLKKAIDVGLKEGKPLSVAQCVNIIIETSKGLHYAHMNEHKGQPLNIVHRDISPHNVMVSYNGEVKLMDFGIAKAAQRSTKTMAGTVKGKVAYMSPEQARGKNLDGRSDLFALGIMLWEMLTGKRLFLGDSDFETLTNVLKNEPPRPSSLNPKVDATLDAIVLKALAKDRDERHKNVEEFQRELTRWYYSTVTDLDGESLKKFMHDVFAEDIETNRRLSLEERGVKGDAPPAEKPAEKSGSNPAATAAPQPVPDQNERTLALPAAEAGAPTVLEGALSAQALKDAMQARKQGGTGGGAAPARPSAPQPVVEAPAAAEPEKKSKAMLWVILAVVLIGGGVAAALALGGGGDTPPAAPTQPAAAPEAPVETADFMFTVDPGAAKVTIDGKVADAKVSGLKLGSTIEVVAEAPGYVRFNQSVKLEQKATTLDIKLEKEREKMSIVLEPVGDDKAEIIVNGKSLGNGAQIFNGFKDDVLKVEIKPSKEGAETITADVTLDGSQKVRKFEIIGAAEAKLTLTLDPAGSTVVASKGTVTPSADGAQAVITGLAVGDTIEITVSKADYTERKESIAIGGAEQTLAMALVKAKAATGPTTAPKPPGGGGGGAAAATGKGTISVRATPWANVSIGGRPVGQTPKDVSVSAGTHTVVMTKGAQVVTKSVKVDAGKTVTVKHSFD
jgi:serine/threonine protein kinase